MLEGGGTWPSHGHSIDPSGLSSPGSGARRPVGGLLYTPRCSVASLLHYTSQYSSQEHTWSVDPVVDPVYIQTKGIYESGCWHVGRNVFVEKFYEINAQGAMQYVNKKMSWSLGFKNGYIMCNVF